MASKQRHMYGDAEVRECAVLAASVIEVGDILWFDASNNVVKPASAYTWDTNLATTQGTFKDVFVGVALSAHAANDPYTNAVRYATTGVFRFACASAAFDLGVFLGPADSGSSTLEDQKVVAVANATLAIGKPARQETAAVTEVRCEIVSAIHYSGVQTIT